MFAAGPIALSADAEKTPEHGSVFGSFDLSKRLLFCLILGQQDIQQDCDHSSRNNTGAAIKLPTTVFDVLLPQIFAGDRLTKEDLTGLAEGGLPGDMPGERSP